MARHLAAGAALLAIDEVMTLWADTEELEDPLALLDQALRDPGRAFAVPTEAIAALDPLLFLVNRWS